MKRQQSAGQELAIDAINEFFAECAELAGVGVDEWLDSEPF
ncbi:MAG: hypothetical protein ACRDC6_32020 [Shewanella sp.]